ncbi:MAG: TldD/PmbA family protein [Candidatus Izimaplasma sp.]|nr:TldD/PmbA family protein [Candidatus Izimaplasma bacterium]
MNFDQLFVLAKEKGIEDLQVYYSGGTNFDIEVFKGSLEKYTIADTAKLSVKGIYDKKMGTVTTEIINDEQFEFIVDSIVASATAIESEDEVFIYEGDKHYKKVEGLYNKELEDVDPKRKIDDTLKLEELVKAEDDRVTMVQAFYGDGTTNVLIQNSKGLKLEKKVNVGVFGAYVIASDGNDQRTAIEYQQSNSYEDFDLQTIAKDGAEKACALLGAKPVDSGAYEVILQNNASTALLAPHISMFSAENIQKGISLLKGKLGTRIASNLISLVDDPFMKKSSKSGSFDDEGVATEYNELIDNGTLKSYMYDLRTAKKDDVTSTGNGFKNGIHPTNLYIKPGETDVEDAIKSMSKGLLITELAGTHAGCNPISGDFSLQASGYLIEDGKKVQPVALITVAGNYLELLKNVTAVCSDKKMNFAFVGSPSVKIKSLQVSGK